MKKLENKTAVITGAGGYIGADIAGVLAKNGARTALIDVREDPAQRAVEAIRQAGRTSWWTGVARSD